MDTTENKTEHFIKKPYPKFKPEKAGEYLCGNRNFAFLAIWDNDCWAVRNPDAISYFFEPSPMEVKDAEAFEKILKNNITIAMEGEGRVIFDYKVASKLCAEFSQLQPPVISAPDFLKEKGIKGFVYKEGNWIKNGLSTLLTEYLQRQGQKNNQNKL